MAKKGFLEGYKTYDTSMGFGNAKKWREALNQRMNKQDAKEILKQTQKSPYEILGVSNNASTAEIKKAFHKLLMEWHPDRNAHRETEALEMTKIIIAAYVDLTS